jgi:hypothetical protein
MTKIAGSGFESESGSGSVSQRHGSADPDSDLDPHQNVMGSQQWYKAFGVTICTLFTKAKL